MQSDRDADAIARIFRRLSGGRDGDEYELASKTLRTWQRYAGALTRYEAYCQERELPLVPAGAATLKGYLTSIVKGDADHPPGSVGTVHIARMMLSLVHRLREAQIDWSPLREFYQGVRRKHGSARRRAKPLRVADLEKILGRLDPTNPRAARDGFLLALGWAAALRSDELVTLGWDAPGPKGKGFITTSSRGVEIHLDVAKTAHDGDGQTVIVPAEDAPLVMTWCDRWVRAAGRQPGRLIFCQMSRSDRPINGPMAAVAVTAVVRTHVLEYLIAGGVEKVAAVAAASHYRSHSLRSGFATEAGARGVVMPRIAEHCRHRSILTTAGYVRLGQDWENSGLKGLLP
jgi:integrase